MKMTFEEYIKNPMGVKNAVFSQREMYRTLYREKMDRILVRENGNIRYQLYTDKANNTFYVYIKIPSEVVPDFYYDTVVEFYGGDAKSKSLKDYYVKFYSNDPAFVFTYAYSFIKNKIFITDLIPKMSREAVKNPAKIKNPKNLVGYVKSLYFAYLTMKKYGLFNKIAFEANSSSYNKKILLNEITPADVKIENRQLRGEEIRHEKEAIRRKERQERKAITQTQRGLESNKSHMDSERIRTAKTATIVNRMKRTGSLNVTKARTVKTSRTSGIKKLK